MAKIDTDAVAQIMTSAAQLLDEYKPKSLDEKNEEYHKATVRDLDTYSREIRGNAGLYDLVKQAVLELRAAADLDAAPDRHDASVWQELASKMEKAL